MKRIVCAADRASTIVHGIWDDIKMVTREVQVSKWQILVVSIILLEVFRNDFALDN